MLFVLAGPSYVGKKTALSHFMKLYSFSSIIPYTTKPEERRYGEVEGIKYHYVAKDDKRKIENDEFIWDKPFQYKGQQDDVLYAYKKTDIKNAIEGYANFIIHASVGNAMKIYDEYHVSNEGHLYILFLNFSTDLSEEFFKKKYEGMGNPVPEGHRQQTGDEEKEFYRRYNHAQKEVDTYYKNQLKFDECIKADYKYEMCIELEKVILPKLMVMPTSPDRIPGALSDVDILYMSEKRKNDMLKISSTTGDFQGEKLREALCGCGVQLTLDKTIRILKKNGVHNYIDMASEKNDIENKLLKLYPEANISTGYILKPNETILCTSEEKVTVPHDVYAIVAARFSYSQLGLSVELGTSVIQAGHSGHVHFQIKNNTNNSICIYPGIQVVQLLFFRTVQPSANSYMDANNHSYNDDSIPPISRFRENNQRLDEVKKPGKNFIKSCFVGIQEAVMAKIVGLAVTITSIVVYAQNIEAFIKKNILPFLTLSSNITKCVIFLILVCVTPYLMGVFGTILIKLFRKVINFFRNKIR